MVGNVILLGFEHWQKKSYKDYFVAKGLAVTELTEDVDVVDAASRLVELDGLTGCLIQVRRRNLLANNPQVSISDIALSLLKLNPAIHLVFTYDAEFVSEDEKNDLRALLPGRKIVVPIMARFVPELAYYRLQGAI